VKNLIFNKELRSDFIVGTLPKEEFSTFTSYAISCFNKFGIQDQKLTESEINGYEQKYTHKQDQLIFCWTFRALLSQVIESLILLDRCLFLIEHNLKVKLFPIFDPYESPRNMVLVASKN